MRSAFVHLQPPHDTMIGEVFGDTGFGNTQMLGQLRLDGWFPAPRGVPPQKIGNGHPEGLASLHVVVGGLVRIRQQPDARACGRTIRVLYFCWRASQQPAEIHLQLRKPRSEAGIAVAAAKTRRGSLRDGFEQRGSSRPFVRLRRIGGAGCGRSETGLPGGRLRTAGGPLVTAATSTATLAIWR